LTFNNKKEVIPVSKTYKRYAPDFKLKVVQAYHSSGKIQPEICAEFGISRSALCQWVKQYKNNGIGGLVNKKTTPKRPARQTAKKIIQEVAELKQQEEHKYRGLQSFSDYLKRFKGISLSITTLSKIFKKQGIPSGAENYQEQVVQVNPRKAELLEKEVLSELNQWERFERTEPNNLWQMDITSFYIKDEGKVYLVDIIDDFSRFLIGWGLFREQTSENVLRVLTEAINRHGAPQELLTDNGRQFTSWHGIAAFEVFLDKRKIKHLRSKPHHPQTLGKLERWHGTVKKELLEVKFFHSLVEARAEIQNYVDYYNYHRTHTALAGLVPADRYFGIANQIKEANDLVSKQTNDNPEVYLIGKIAGQNFRIQTIADSLKLYRERDLIYQLRLDELKGLWGKIYGTPSPNNQPTQSEFS